MEPIAKRQWEGVRQAVHFYQVFQDRNLSLRSLGVSDKDIQQTAEAVEQLWRLKEERLRQKSDSEQGTQDRRQAHNALRRWIMDFRTIARVAFRDQPQRLEMFGIRVRSSVKDTSITAATDVIIAEPQFPTDSIVTDL